MITVPFSPSEEAQIKKQIFTILRNRRRHETKKAERIAADKFRSRLNCAHNDQLHEMRIDSLGSELSKLKSLLELRRKLTHEISEGLRNAKIARHEYRLKASKEQEKLARGAVRSISRHRSALSTRKSECETADQVLIDRLISVEKAKQLSETVTVPTNPRNGTDISSKILQRLDETKQAIKLEKLRQLSRCTARPHNNVLPDAYPDKPTQTRTVTQSAVHAKIDVPHPNRVSGSKSAVLMSSNRRSQSGSRKSWEGGTKTASTETFLPTEPDENVIVAERRDPLSATERKRAILAALKLKR